MTIAVVFGIGLLLAVLLSAKAARSMLSLPLLFLLVGIVLGNGGLEVIAVDSDGDLVRHVAEIALFVVLFTDGMRALAPMKRQMWRPPVRALLVGMPLTAVVIALLAWLLTGLPFAAALLLGIVLSPTDPVLVSAFIRREDVPYSLRHMLNVESGINDGLALPGVVVLIAVLGAANGPSWWLLLAELAGGAVFGAACAATLGLLLRIRGVEAQERIQALAPLALAVTIYGGAHLLHANTFLAAFVAGAVVAKTSPKTFDEFEILGDQLAELLKFFTLLVFGALLELRMLQDTQLGAYVVAVLALLVARPASLMLSLLGTRLPVRQRLAAAWLGPKGLASMLYGLYVLQSGVPWAEEVFAIAALGVVLSVAVHTTTDIAVARRLHGGELTGA